MNVTEKMNNIKTARLPGFYIDETNRYGIVIYNPKYGVLYICCFVNGDTGEYDVTVDGVDESGDFADNIEWESYNEPEDALKALRRMLKKYGRQ